MQQATQPSAEEIQARVEAILAQSEYAAADHISLAEYLFAKLYEVLEQISSLAEGAPRTASALLYVLLLGLAALVIYILYKTIAEVGMIRRKHDAQKNTSQARVFEGRAANLSDAFKRAHAALQVNDQHLAVWLLHRVLLALLDNRGQLQFKPWKTNSHYLRECSPNLALFPLLNELSEAYEAIIYAHRDHQGVPLADLLKQVEPIVAGEQ